MDLTKRLEQLNGQRDTVQGQLNAALDARNAAEIARITPELEALDKEIVACKSKLNIFATDAELGNFAIELGTANSKLLEAAPKADDIEALKGADFEKIAALQSAVKEIEDKMTARRLLLVKIADDSELNRLSTLLHNTELELQAAVDAKQYDMVATITASIGTIAADIKTRKEELGAGEDADDTDDVDDTDDTDTDGDGEYEEFDESILS